MEWGSWKIGTGKNFYLYIKLKNLKFYVKIVFFPFNQIKLYPSGLQSLHGAVMFKGAKWPREGREFEFDVDELWDSVIKEGEPRMHSKKLRMSKYMGQTRMSPDEIRVFVDEWV